MDDETEDVEAAPITGVLRRDVQVAGDGWPVGSPLKKISAGTDARNIPPSELAQLCQEHFD